MSKFLVVRGKVARDGKIYRRGDEVELPDKIAGRMPIGALMPVGILAQLKDLEGKPMEVPQGDIKEPIEIPSGAGVPAKAEKKASPKKEQKAQDTQG